MFVNAELIDLIVYFPEIRLVIWALYIHLIIYY